MAGQKYRNDNNSSYKAPNEVIPKRGERLWLFEFLKCFCSFSSTCYMMGLNHTLEIKVMAIWICRELPGSILSVSIYYARESEIWVKSYIHLNFTRASVLQFWTSRYIMGLNHTPSQKLCRLNLPRGSMFNFRHLKILCTWIRHLGEMLWLFEFNKSFSCLILSVLIHHAPQSYTRVKSYAIWIY